jgi:hypothetical protein
MEMINGADEDRGFVHENQANRSPILPAGNL